jgi:4-hydroxy-tetrahydrodipicolinate synthase
MKWNPAGVISGAITPFTDDDTIDWESLHKHLHHLAGSGVNGLLINASMAEGGHLTGREREQILDFAVREIGDEVPVLTTVYGANTAEAAAEARRAAAAGAQGLLIYPHPAFGGLPLDPDLPAAYFRAIWSAAGLPMIAFRTPASLAPTLPLEALLRLGETPGVAAIKDSTGDLRFYTGDGGGSRFLAADSPLKVLADYDPLILDFLRAGAHGATVISSVVDPDRYVELFDTRALPTADRLYARLARFARAVYQAPFRDFRARLKEALEHDGIIATSHVRRPLPPLSAAERDRIVDALAASRDEST